ncbi:MAG: hypothetical protein F9K28_07540 [Bacteroidetes bacterium]|nr:MAG: hypothetical protein F9K28_07540 [Bacteroidota bacterium]
MAEILTLTNFENATLDQWQYALQQIYDKKNEKRQPSDMWLRTVSDASKVGEAARKGDAYEVMKYLVHTVSWVITTTNKLMTHQYNGLPSLQTYDGRSHTSLTQIILAKYPMICPVCQEKQCHCPIKRKDIEEADPIKRQQIKAANKETRRQKLLARQLELETDTNSPKSVADIAAMLDEIYKQVHYGESIQNITFHFLEEVGEVAWCLTSLDEGNQINPSDETPLNIQLADEIADVMAWSLAIVGKLANSATQTNRLMSVFHPIAQSTTEDKEISKKQKHNLLAQWLWSSFYDRDKLKICCPLCKEEPCICGKR